MRTIPICKECAHHFNYSYGSGPTCQRPIAKPLDIVTGATSSPLFAPCGRERSTGWFKKDRCGPEGRYYEPPTPLPSLKPPKRRS